MDTMFQKDAYVGAFFDDILVTRCTEQESLRNLDAILTKLGKAGLHLKKEKCTFIAEEVVFLGHRVNKEGITPVPDKVEALVQEKAPENVTQLKAYLGLLAYYGRFLKGLSQTLHPLYRLLKKATKWHWGQNNRTVLSLPRE